MMRALLTTKCLHTGIEAIRKCEEVRVVLNVNSAERQKADDRQANPIVLLARAVWGNHARLS
jgi:hypothetical protein